MRNFTIVYFISFHYLTYCRPRQMTIQQAMNFMISDVRTHLRIIIQDNLNRLNTTLNSETDTTFMVRDMQIALESPFIIGAVCKVIRADTTLCRVGKLIYQYDKPLCFLAVAQSEIIWHNNTSYYNYYQVRRPFLVIEGGTQSMS